MHRLLSDRARGWRRALCGIVLGLLAWSAHGVPAKAPQDLRIDGEVLPGRSIDLLEQALSRVKFNTDPQQLRRGLVENRLLARAVEDQPPRRAAPISTPAWRSRPATCSNRYTAGATARTSGHTCASPGP